MVRFQDLSLARVAAAVLAGCLDLWLQWLHLRAATRVPAFLDTGFLTWDTIKYPFNIRLQLDSGRRWAKQCQADFITNRLTIVLTKGDFPD